MRYELINYDVWGNAEDGYTVNQAFHTSKHVDIPMDSKHDEIVRIIKDAGFIDEDAPASRISIDGDPDFGLRFEDSENGEPLFALQAERSSAASESPGTSTTLSVVASAFDKLSHDAFVRVESEKDSNWKFYANGEANAYSAAAEMLRKLAKDS